MPDIEATFHQAMLDIYSKALRELRYNATYFAQMVEQRGGVETARLLLSTENVQYGFDKLWESNRLDLTVEFHVLQPCFKQLFDENTQKEAVRRLKDLDYMVDEDGNLRRYDNT